MITIPLRYSGKGVWVYAENSFDNVLYSKESAILCQRHNYKLLIYSTATRVYLSIFGEQFDPAALTALVGLSPTEMGIKGELIEGRHIPCRETFWNLHAEPSTDLDLKEVINLC